MTDGDLVNHSLRGGTFQALHGVLHRLLGFGEVLHLRREDKLQAAGVTEPAGFQICLSFLSKLVRLTFIFFCH